MRRIVPLKSITPVSGGRALIELDQLPTDYCLKGLHFSMPFYATNASGAAAVNHYTLNRFIDSVKIGKRISTTGSLMDKLAWLSKGSDSSALAGLPAFATSSGAFSRVLNLVLPFADYDAYEADDTSPNVAAFRSTPVELAFGAFATLLGANWTPTMGTFQPLAIIQKVQPGRVAPPTIIDYVDAAGYEARLEPGVYTHLFVAKEDGAPITSAEVTDMTVYVDGEPVLDRITVAQLGALFNFIKAKGTEPQSATIAVTGITIPGEGVTDQPTTAADAGAGVVNAEFLPLLYPQPAGKLSKAWMSGAGIKVKWAGSLSSLRFGFRRIEPQADAAVVKAAAKVGVANPTTIRAKTASKAPLGNSPRARLVASILPKQVE
jgi:hypothetical protein